MHLSGEGIPQAGLNVASVVDETQRKSSLGDLKGHIENVGKDDLADTWVSDCIGHYK